MIGRQLGRYRIVEKLGAGGMGVVWRAHDERLGRDVALKVLPDDLVTDATARARLLREARAASSLSHPNILTVYDADEADGHVFLAMEFIPGRPLRELIATGELTPDAVVRLGIQVADALSHAHEHGIVHRDIKPSNVLVTPEGQAKVLDFGLAQRVAASDPAEPTLSQTLTSGLSGTPVAIAPELWRGEAADARSDIWALGSLLHTMLSGAPPFRGGTVHELSAAILAGEPSPLPAGIAPGLRAIVARCLERDPARRFRSAAEVRAALEATAAAGGSLGRGHGRAPRARFAILAFCALGLAALGGLAFLILPMLRSRVAPGTPARIASLAVLPLDNLSHDPDQQYFADGMTEELITRLAQLGAVRVTSRISVMRFRGTTEPLSEVARKLGVDAIVVGSVERAGERIRISAQLIRATTDEHMWAQSYERAVGDAFTLQDEVAAAIAGEILGALAPRPRPSPHRGGRVEPAVLQAYLRGLDAYQRWSLLDSRRALGFFDHALAADSAFAPAWSGRAQALFWVSVAPETVALSDVALRRALELDPGLGEAHAVRAEQLYERDWNWAESEREFRRAVELAPSSVNAHHMYSHLLTALGRDREAREQATIAIAIDPLSPSMYDHMGWLEYMEGRFDESVAASRKAQAIDPTYAAAYLQEAVSPFARHDWAEWKAALERASRAGALVDPLELRLAEALRADRHDEALRLVNAILLPTDTYAYSQTQLAAFYLVLGDRDQAFAMLQRGEQVRDPMMGIVNVDPALKDLRSDPRYADLRRRMGLPL